VDVNAKIDELIEIVESARAMPMSASCVINRAQVLDLLDDLKRGLPEEMDRAQRVLADRESVLADGRREAERLIERTRSERDSIIGNTDVSREARGAADRILAEARGEAEQIRVEADDYVDQKLANFEVVLTKTLQAVGRGRDKMRGNTSPMDELGRHVDEQDLVEAERKRSRDFSGQDGFESFDTGEFTREAIEEADRPYQQHEFPQADFPQQTDYPQQPEYQQAEYAQSEYAPAAEYAQGDYPQNDYAQGDYPEGAAAAPAPYAAQAQQQPEYGYEQGAYDQGAAQGYGTGEFQIDPQYQSGSYSAQPSYGEQLPYAEQSYGEQPAYADQPYGAPAQQQAAPPQYGADDTSYFDTGLIDVRQFQQEGYRR
jgi:hypothetical protein